MGQKEEVGFRIEKQEGGLRPTFFALIFMEWFGRIELHAICTGFVSSRLVLTNRVFYFWSHQISSNVASKSRWSKRSCP